MINFSKYFGKNFTIQHEEWTLDDTDDLRMLKEFPKFPALVKLINNRLNSRKEDLVNGKDSRDRIDELADLLLELNYEGS